MSLVRILLVDDEAEFVEALGTRLEVRGLTCETATSHDEAILKIKSRDFDVVILDVRMPGTSGIETLEHIKSHKPLIEVIMLSGIGTEQTAIEAMQRGAFDFLTKPPNVDDLMEKIHQAHIRKTEHLDRINRARGASTGGDISFDQMPQIPRSLCGAGPPTADCAHHGRLLVLARDSSFSRELIDYGLSMAERFSFAVLAVNAAGIARGAFNSFPTARQRAFREFLAASERNVQAFQMAAAERDIPFAHVVRFEDQDEAIRRIQDEVGEIEFVVTEPEEGLFDPHVPPCILVYSIA